MTLFLQNTFFLQERTCAKKEYGSFGKAFLLKKRFVLKEKTSFFSKAFFFHGNTCE